ncbi:hypothetical protein JHN63_38475 [Streptomyces sp. MBT65]|nr:hypothetical protein [Streptomyces sp. MBT65]MBK3579585.1 hypothetical protein [Streptomyces sp. MBT65]
MHEPRPSSPGAGAVFRSLVPPPALCGFLLLLTLMFGIAYGAGSRVGPVAPGMHGTSGTGGTGITDGTGDTGDGDTGDSDTGDMGDMNMHGGAN